MKAKNRSSSKIKKFVWIGRKKLKRLLSKARRNQLKHDLVLDLQELYE